MGDVRPLETRQALILTALLIAILKCLELAVDSQVVIHYDSGAYIRNGLGLEFNPTRSYVYGGLVSMIGLPLHSLRAVIAAQAAMGGLTACLLAYALIRFLFVRYWLAIGAAIVFALDPVQISLEHYILPEATAMLATAVFLVIALHYLEDPKLLLLIELSLLGTVLVSLRILYVPVVLTMAVIVPIVAWSRIGGNAKQLRCLSLALLVYCGSTLAFHAAYKHLTGVLADREPAYEYSSGLFLVATVSPILTASDTRDAQVARIVQTQNHTRYPLQFDLRVLQLWSAEGLVSRLLNAFRGDKDAANSAAGSLARHAISRDPLGFLQLGWRTFAGYFARVAGAHGGVEWIRKTDMVHEQEAAMLASYFVEYAARPNNEASLALRYLLLTCWWYAFLLASPFLLAVALLAQPVNLRGLALLLLWNCLLLTATCLGAVESDLRYLQPFSLTSVAGAAVLIESVIGRRWGAVSRFSRRAVLRNDRTLF